MATTKELLETAMLKVGSATNAPTGSRISLSVDQTTNNFQSYTPTCDGYVEMNGIAQTDTIYMWADRQWLLRNAVPCIASGSSMVLTVPVFKGKLASFQFAGNWTERRLTFIKSIGGGGLGFLRKLLSVEVCYGYA